MTVAKCTEISFTSYYVEEEEEEDEDEEESRQAY